MFDTSEKIGVPESANFNENLGFFFREVSACCLRFIRRCITHARIDFKVLWPPVLRVCSNYLSSDDV